MQILAFTPYSYTALDTVLLRYDLLVWQEQNAHLAAQARLTHPNIKHFIYELPGRGVDWQAQWPTINANESWFKHNPEGSLNVADRVRRYENQAAGEIYYIMDLSNASYRAFMIDVILSQIDTHGLDGYFNDGPFYFLSLRVGNWILPPTTSQQNNWQSEQVRFLSELRAAIGRKLIWGNCITTTEVAGVESSVPFYQYLDGALEEGFCHDGNQPAANNGRTSVIWNWQMARYQEALDNGVWFAGFTSAAGGTIAQREKHCKYGFASYLLKAEGESAFGFTADGLTIMESAVGKPTGSAFQEGSGVWRRDFTGGYCRVNPTTASVGGLEAASGEIVLTPPSAFERWT